MDMQEVFKKLRDLQEILSQKFAVEKLSYTAGAAELTAFVSSLKG